MVLGDAAEVSEFRHKDYQAASPCYCTGMFQRSCIFCIDIYRCSIYGGKKMAIDKSLLTGSTTMLILKLLDETNMYRYQMIEELRKKSNNAFELKAGTLYPLLHTLEQKNMLTSYEEIADNTRVRKYYSITKTGA